MSRKLTDSDLCPFLITNSENSIFQRPVDNMIEQAIRCHLRCLRVSSTYHDELKTKDCALFHITFYEIIQRNSTSKVTELWPSGDLYGDKQQHPKGSRQIREAALTIVAVPCREMSGSKARAIFWTMICLRPSQFPHLYYSEQGDEVARRRTNEMIDDMGDLVHNSLVTVLSRWNEIARYFDELLTEKRDLLRPDYHDSLLTDDDNFSRSKKYFWAIEFLKEACNSISDNIQQIKHFLEFLESNPPGTKKAENEFFLKLKRHYLTIQKLETLETRLKLKKEEAAALRDGLFSASAVMDSRASYQLGQNVKLLTLVSIFFLPLSFCASIWSVNNSIFSMTAFAIVTPILGIMTYVVAFNLENIASCFKRPRKPSSVHRPSRPQRSEKKGTSESTWKSEEDIHSRPEYSGKQPLWTRRNLPIWPRELIWKLLTLVGGLMPPRRKKRRRLEEEFQPTSLADLRDVHVKVEVNVEESGAT
ncbi:uncharacterized protein LY89DRAFT_409247 [Mollisia scopiformis]|uniref:Uncharacterized protein n=1 Tax=Mollisia scopiformis TaxID=149040 RepID=A0A132B245_MOLSC|nr:uncharacterized protein LY89DRAFT_409247 [Mollisia scopiformis]KUJ06456.1 hypothetical protein LY89DRAFT_409247 [Mollisia scopiformis]